jgi:hypothetical protein
MISMDIASRLLHPSLGILLTLVFGFWLSRRGRPYNGLLFNIHKLVALATVLLSGMAVFQLLKGKDAAAGVIILVAIATASVIVLFASGAFLSANKGEYRVMKSVHNSAPVFAVLSMVSLLFLLT